MLLTKLDLKTVSDKDSLQMCPLHWSFLHVTIPHGAKCTPRAGLGALYEGDSLAAEGPSEALEEWWGRNEVGAKSMVLTELEKAACQGRDSLVWPVGPRGGLHGTAPPCVWWM